MYISNNFKAKCRQAKQDGYTDVYSVGGSYRATTYITRWPIDELLNMPVGTSLRAYRAGYQGRWTGRANTRHVTETDIQYSRLMSQYE